jgi:hypothetical protein
MKTSPFCQGLVLCFALAGFASAQTTTRVSLGTGGIEGNAPSDSPAISARGRYVAFFSEASNLVPGDTNGADDIFRRDRRTGTTIRVSVDSSGREADGDSYSPAISGGGRYVAFYSEASNLVPGDTNGVNDIFVHDVVSGITSRVSVDSAGLQGDDQSYYPSLSANGRFVSFDSRSTNLVPGDTNGGSDVFVHDRWTGITTRVSVDPAGAQADNHSEYSEICADGSRVVFESWAGNLVAGDSNGAPDIFVRDLVAGTTLCASVDPSGVPGSGGCSYSSISGNGRVVGFASWSPDLVAGDTNHLTDVFVHDLATGLTALASVSSSGIQGNGISVLHTPASLSHDGRFVAFKSFASTLVPGDTNGMQDIFLRDCRLGTTTRVSVDSQGLQANGPSSQPAISADGRTVGFYSSAFNLVPGDTNATLDVFVWRMW